MGSEKIVDLSLNSFPICMGFTEPPFLCLNSVPTFVECFSAPQPSARSGGGPTLPIRRLLSTSANSQSVRAEDTTWGDTPAREDGDVWHCEKGMACIRLEERDVTSA